MCVCVWKFVEVILCKLLPQIFLEKITSINDNIFSFFYKTCQCFAFSPFVEEACKVLQVLFNKTPESELFCITVSGVEL